MDKTFDLDYTNPYGLWTVTTEADCEGRSVRNLGVFEGFVDDIALALAKECYYALTFHKVLPKPAPKRTFKKTGDEVNIVLDIESGTWRMSPEDRIEYCKKIFKDRDVAVVRGNVYASVGLISGKKEAELKASALSKLTSEEKEALGL